MEVTDWEKEPSDIPSFKNTVSNFTQIYQDTKRSKDFNKHYHSKVFHECMNALHLSQDNNDNNSLFFEQMLLFWIMFEQK